MKTTNRKVESFRQIAEVFLRNSGLDNTRLFFAVKKVFKKTEGISNEYGVAQQDAREELAAVDKDTKILLITNEKYQFTPENKRKLNTKLLSLANAVVEVDSHIISASDLPKKLSFTFTNRFGQTENVSDYDVRNAFEDFVITELEEPTSDPIPEKQEEVEA